MKCNSGSQRRSLRSSSETDRKGSGCDAISRTGRSHLAIALNLTDQKMSTTFVCRDSVLVRLARQEGMVVANPLEP